MPIRVKCEKCKKTLSVKDHLAGKKIKCPVCQSVLAVPLAAPTKEAPAAGVSPAPKAAPKPASAPPAAGAKPAVATKPVAKGKPKPGSNGVAPPTNGAKTNGKAPSAPIELPPENVEEEALSALVDEPTPPPEEIAAPKTIDFKCQWCDEDVKLPIELAGKQAQCPNPECKRIVKVPLPKTPEKKDWRKMERQGPAAARVNLPEALDNAWGTEEATRARQDSLAKAGAVDLPAKPPLGVFGWLRIGFRAVAIVALLSVAGLGIYRLSQSHEQHNVVKEIKLLLDGKDAKISDKLLKAEALRTLALYHLHGREQKADLAWNTFEGARSLVDVGDVVPPEEKPALNEQFFLIDLALAQIEAGGSGDDVSANVKKRKEWKDVQPGLQTTLAKIQTPHIRVIALREVAARLLEKGQKEMPIALAGSLSSGDNPGTKNRPTSYRQQIALVYAADKLATLDGLKEPDLATKEPLEDGNLRVGFAEGYARKKMFDQAFKLANLEGPEEDQLNALVGIAAVALQDKNKEKATEAFKAALEKARNPKDKSTVISPWQWLELARLGARLDETEAVKGIIEPLPAPFKLRAHLEVFLALCDKSTTPVSPDALDDLVADDEKDCITLALAWMALARQHARMGASRKDCLKTLENYEKTTTAALKFDLIRPMVVVGFHQGVRSQGLGGT